jgi:hypothetical protein
LLCARALEQLARGDDVHASVLNVVQVLVARDQGIGSDRMASASK